MGEDKETVYSPVGVLEYYLRTEESETISSMASTSETDGLKKSSKLASRWRDLVQQFKTKSKKPIANLHPLSVMKFSKRLSSSMREHIGFMTNPFESRDSTSLKPRWRCFTIHELQNATNSFSPDNLIGRGGYAEVFRGQLRDGQLIAIKRLVKGHSDERIADFLSELGVMAHVDHPNTAKLIGYGIEGGMHLVLELSPHGSLASLLHGDAKEKLKWNVRYKIAVGTAEGLLYLHEGCPRRIIHRDIKASNILLSQDFEPRICDYGLSKWLPQQWTHHIVPKFEGTFGYLAPEYLMHGIVDEKTDVYAFGVLLLELVSGRRALDYSKESLVVWAKPLIKRNNIRELVDPSLEDDYKQVQLNIMVLTAFLCIQQSSIRRPQMRQVVQLLKGNRESMEMMKKCYKASFWKRYHLVDALNNNNATSNINSREDDDLSLLLPSIQNLLSVGVLGGGGRELRHYFV